MGKIGLWILDKLASAGLNFMVFPRGREECSKILPDGSRQVTSGACSTLTDTAPQIPPQANTTVPLCQAKVNSANGTSVDVTLPVPSGSSCPEEIAKVMKLTAPAATEKCEIEVGRPNTPGYRKMKEEGSVTHCNTALVTAFAPKTSALMLAHP